MQLENKTVIIHGAGAIGGAVARVFAREGARVFVASRSRPRLDALARDVAAAGRRVETAVVDALDEAAVERHADDVVARTGGIDIALNAVGIAHLQGPPLSETSFAEFATPLHGVTRTNFLTARAAALRMAPRGRGVILMISTPGSRMAGAGFLGYGAACAAIENMTRGLAGEFGPAGLRAVCLRSHAIPEALAAGSYTNDAFQQVASRQGIDVDTLLNERMSSGTLMGRLPTLGEVAEMAAFMASDRASATTGAIINLTCGAVVD